MHCNLAMRILMHNANSYLHWSEKILQIVGTKHNRFTYNKKPILLWSSMGRLATGLMAAFAMTWLTLFDQPC